MKPFRSSGQSFNEIPLSDPKKSSFDLSYTNKGSGKIGRLIPVSQKECLPGDRISCDVHSLLRFEPLAVPLLSDMNLRHHQYFVPFRQVWSSFESFITGGKDGYSDSHVVPSVTLKGVMMTLCYNWIDFVTDLIDQAGFTSDIFGDGFTTSHSVVDSAGFPYGKRLLSYIWLELPYTSSGQVSSASIAPRIRQFCHFVYHAFSGTWDKFYFSGVADVFNSKYGRVNSLATSADPLCAFDVYRYDVRHILDKWSDLSTMPFGSSSFDNSTDRDKIFAEAEVFFRDLYDLIFTPFVGPSSTWDYLGYPVDFWNRDGYYGIMSAKKNDGGVATHKTITDYNYTGYIQDGNHILPTNAYYTLRFNSDSKVRFAVQVEQASNYDVDVNMSVLPLRAMYRIWYYNYRDQNLEFNVLDPDSSAFKSDYGYDYLLSLLMPRCVAWSKDTFTTATLQAYSTNLVVPIRDESETQLEESTLEVPIVDLPEGTSQNATIKIPTHFVQKDNSPLASISGLTLSNLRKVQALARWLDKNLFVGFQYADQLFSHYNVKYSDARLQIPEYLAGNSEIVRMEVITNNTTIPGSQTAGDQVARAQGLTRSSVDGYFLEEHGLYFAMMSVLPDQSYPFGLDRSLLMTNKFDIAFPEFAQLGSDIVNSVELFFDSVVVPGESSNFKAFGYQGRYYHYKSNRNEQHGELNSTRREWTFARFFDKPPVLNADFVHCTPNLQMFVSPYSDQFVYDVLINLRAQRSLPVYDQVL